MLTLEGVREEGGEGFGLFNGFSPVHNRVNFMMQHRNAIVRVFLNCWCGGRNRSGCMSHEGRFECQPASFA